MLTASASAQHVLRAVPRNKLPSLNIIVDNVSQARSAYLVLVSYIRIVKCPTR